MSLSLKSVLITDEIDEKCIKILENSGISVLKNTKFSKEELLVEIADVFKFHEQSSLDYRALKLIPG
ncbi:hypothetical protein KUTeg_008083 [Tegillarca granosa]|uniref:Uncharacterized protein n=1 Tax=Tegillarca granosa TaxID=220873 RepID=A0ABQ9F842_TEGGR|nr:hypothetical protein KUTeg_008083 [Tegillarca granosa]